MNIGQLKLIGELTKKESSLQEEFRGKKRQKLQEALDAMRTEFQNYFTENGFKVKNPADREVLAIYEAVSIRMTFAYDGDKDPRLTFEVYQGNAVDVKYTATVGLGSIDIGTKSVGSSPEDKVKESISAYEAMVEKVGTTPCEYWLKLGAKQVSFKDPKSLLSQLFPA